MTRKQTIVTAETLARIDELERLKKDIAHNLWGRDITEYKAGGYDATQIAIDKIDERIKELKK